MVNIKGVPNLMSIKVGFKFTNVESALASLRSRVLFNRFAAYHRAEIFDATEMSRGKLVKVEPVITHMIASGRNVMAINMEGVTLDSDGHIVDIDEELKSSATILNTENCFRNMVYTKRDNHFAFVFDPQTRLFVFSQNERNHITLSNGFKVVRDLGQLKADTSPIMFKGQLKTDEKADILGLSTTLFTLMEIQHLGPEYIEWVYKTLAAGLAGIGCLDCAEIHDMVSERREVTQYLKNQGVKTLSEMASARFQKK